MMAFLSGWVGEVGKLFGGALIDTMGSKGKSSSSSESAGSSRTPQRLNGPRMPFDRPEAAGQSKAAKVEDPQDYINVWMRRMAQFSQIPE